MTQPNAVYENENQGVITYDDQGVIAVLPLNNPPPLPSPRQWKAKCWGATQSILLIALCTVWWLTLVEAFQSREWLYGWVGCTVALSTVCWCYCKPYTSNRPGE